MASKAQMADEIDVLVECLASVRMGLGELDPDSDTIVDDISDLQNQADEVLADYSPDEDEDAEEA